jgi:single-strand DNA-binding protein
MAPSDKETTTSGWEPAMSSTNLNRVIVTGYLTQDPELHVLPSGSSACKLWIANNVRRRNPTTGDWIRKPNYFEIVVFGGQAEIVAKYMSKGRPIAIDGSLDWRSWETKDGRKAQAVNIIAETIQFIGDSPNSKENRAIAASEAQTPETADGDGNSLEVEEETFAVGAFEDYQ